MAAYLLREKGHQQYYVRESLHGIVNEIQINARPECASHRGAGIVAVKACISTMGVWEGIP
jgi:hypothetical protein